MDLGPTPEKSLTIILLLDQLSRNTMRGPETPFVWTKCDPVSIQFAHHCIKQGLDKSHPPHKQFWYYMPLSHSESLADQELSVAKNLTLLWELRQTQWKEFHPIISEGLDDNLDFYKIIKQFGRFPNRNVLLNREMTEQEQKFLDEGGWKF